MMRKEIWRIRFGVLILLIAVAWVTIRLAGGGKTCRSWEAIRESGTLRAVTALPVDQLRSGRELLTSQRELAMLERFALDHGLELLVFRKEEEQLGRALLRNWADVAFSELEPGSNECPQLQEVHSGLGSVWWIPHGALSLEKRLREFAARKAEIFKKNAVTGDLAQIRERRILRVLMLETPQSQRHDRNELLDLEYDLAVEFADQLDVRLVIFPAPDRETMERWLLEGKGDMGAAVLPPALPDFELPLPAGVLPLLSLAPETEGAAPEVSTVSGENGISLLLFSGMPVEYAWFFRAEDTELKKAAGSCIAGYSGFGLHGGKSHYRLEMKSGGLRLSPFDFWIRKYAAEHGFDWLLIGAQIFQESRFAPGVIADDGGLGLMQLMPFTVSEMNCLDPLNPRQNIRAGVAYLAKQYARIGDEVEPPDRLRFALAAYNGGYGHLEDARRLAAQLGLDPNRWEGEVEKAYGLLSRKGYYAKARYGFCRSDIIIRYVNEIMARYLDYTRRNRAAAEIFNSR